MFGMKGRRGRIDEAMGRAKVTTGLMTGNRRMVVDGETQLARSARRSFLGGIGFGKRR